VDWSMTMLEAVIPTAAQKVLVELSERLAALV
jgi:hypothetical protein